MSEKKGTMRTRMSNTSHSGFILFKDKQFLVENQGCFSLTENVEEATLYPTHKIARSKARAKKMKGYTPMYVNKDIESLNFLKRQC